MSKHAEYKGVLRLNVEVDLLDVDQEDVANLLLAIGRGLPAEIKRITGIDPVLVNSTVEHISKCEIVVEEDE